MHWLTRCKIESAESHRSLAHTYLRMSCASELGSFARFYRGEAVKQLRYAIADIRSAKRIERAQHERAA